MIGDRCLENISYCLRWCEMELGTKMGVLICPYLGEKDNRNFQTINTFWWEHWLAANRKTYVLRICKGIQRSGTRSGLNVNGRPTKWWRGSFAVRQTERLIVDLYRILHTATHWYQHFSAWSAAEMFLGKVRHICDRSRNVSPNYVSTQGCRPTSLTLVGWSELRRRSQRLSADRILFWASLFSVLLRFCIQQIGNCAAPHRTLSLVTALKYFLRRASDLFDESQSALEYVNHLIKTLQLDGFDLTK